MRGTRVTVICTDDWYTLSHRAALIEAFVRAGAEVEVITDLTMLDGETRIEALGARVRPFSFARGLLGQWLNLLRLPRLRAMLRDSQPDVVHLVSMVPMLWGSLAAPRFSARVLAVTGLGDAFGRSGVRGAVLRGLVLSVYRMLAHAQRVAFLFQNEEDMDLVGSGAARVRERAFLVRGSGVDPSRFCKPMPQESPRLLVHASRMLRTKGVLDSVQAAHILRARGLDVHLILAGRTHPDNPASFSSEELEVLAAEPWIDWRGHVQDIETLLASASVLLLPTRYREGVPMILLEGACAGVPLIASDMPGCRDVVLHEETGLLVPPGDARALADAIERVLNRLDWAQDLTQFARKRVIEQFSTQVVNQATLRIYDELLGACEVEDSSRARES